VKQNEEESSAIVYEVVRSDRVDPTPNIVRIIEMFDGVNVTAWEDPDGTVRINIPRGTVRKNLNPRRLVTAQVEVWREHFTLLAKTKGQTTVKTVIRNAIKRFGWELRQPQSAK
jgi:hypothetical protein